jgi:uncharacterized protein
MKNMEIEEEEEEEVSDDGKTIVKPLITLDNNVSNNTNNKTLNTINKGNAVLLAGFSGAGLVGSISSNHIIEQMQMHQIAYVDSDFVTPSAVYIGEKLRHPFRIYTDETGNLCVLICDAPILKSGIRSVFDAVVKWAKRQGIKEIVTLEGIPFEGIPPENRKPIVLSSSSSSKLPAQHQQQPQSSTRQTDSNTTVSQLPNTQVDITDNAIPYEHSLAPVVYISGFPGALISACLSNAIACTAILIPAPTGIADPEGSAILIEELTKIDRIPFSVDTTYLRQKGEELRNQLKRAIDSVKGQQERDRSMQMGEIGMYG